jgi:uncharacterized protein
MNELLQTLLKLQAIDFRETSEKFSAAAIAEMRGKVPVPILAHYDRLIARGKKGVALVRNQVCAGCHMRVPIGAINTLMHGNDIQLCGSCGRYLCLAEAAPEVPAPAPVKKPRKRKVAATASA